MEESESLTLWEAYQYANKRRCSLRVRMIAADKEAIVGSKTVDGKMVLLIDGTAAKTLKVERVQ